MGQNPRSESQLEQIFISMIYCMAKKKGFNKSQLALRAFGDMRNPLNAMKGLMNRQPSCGNKYRSLRLGEALQLAEVVSDDPLQIFTEACRAYETGEYPNWYSENEELNTDIEVEKAFHPVVSCRQKTSSLPQEKKFVAYECPCDEKKEEHHPDYRNPALVILLCKKHHRIEHKRLNELGIDPLDPTKTSTTT